MTKNASICFDIYLSDKIDSDWDNSLKWNIYDDELRRCLFFLSYFNKLFFSLEAACVGKEAGGKS